MLSASYVRDHADLYGDLHRLSPKELRLLGKSATRLYERLEAVLGTQQWESAKLWMVAKRIGMNYRTAKRALARLRDCGAVVTEDAQGFWHPRVMEFISGPRLGWCRTLKYKCLGVMTRGGRPMLPRRGWQEWAAGRGSWGGKRAKQVVPINPRIGFSSRACSATCEVKLSPKYTIYTNTLTHGPCSNEQGLQPSTAGTPAIFSPDTLAERPALVPRPVPYPRPTLSPPDRAPALPVGIDRRMSDIDRVEALARAYRRAVAKEFGVQSKFLRYQRGARVARTKFYKPLLAGARALIEHGINPQAWADWFMARAKDRELKKPPPPTMVFSAAAVTKQRGWFRKDYSGPKGWIAVVTKAHREQICRLREVLKLNRGMTQEGALAGLPPWYVRKRRVELAAGHDDPNDYYPPIRTEAPEAELTTKQRLRYEKRLSKWL